MVIGGNPGGGYDLYARALMRHFGRHIPGEPSFIGQNMPGAGSLNLANHMYTRAPKDGLTIGMVFPGVIVGPLLDERMKAPFKPSEFIYLGSANCRRACARPITPRKTRTFDYALTRETVMGADAPGGSPFDYPVPAPRGPREFSGRARLQGKRRHHAVDGAGRGRRHCGLDWASLRGQRPHWVQDKRMHVILQGGLEDHPGLRPTALPRSGNTSRTRTGATCWS